MKFLLSLLLAFAALDAFAQGRAPVVLETVADAMARRARAGEEIQIRNNSTNILWSAPRAFTATVATNAHDGVHYITNATAGLVFVSQDRFAVSQLAEWFGAGADDAVDDAAPIQAAIDWLDGRSETWSGVTNAVTGEVVLPAGNLVFASAVLVDGPFGIRGAGRESTVITCTSTNDGFNVTIPYFAGQYSYAYLHDFSLFKSLDNRTGNGINQGYGGSQTIAERINITGFANGLTVQGWAGSFRDITIQETGSNSVWFPSSFTFGYNQTSTQFERVLAKNGVGNGFNIENSSYCSFFSCYSEKHTNGIGWRIVATPDRTTYGNNYAIQMENCASEFDLVALQAERASSLRWTGGMMIPRNETTNVVRFVGPVQAKLDGVEVALPYTPSQAGYTVWVEDDSFGGWPHDIQIHGGQWRRLLSGLENKPGTVKWVDSFTNPSPFRDLPADAPSMVSTASSGSISFDLTWHTIGTNAFTLYLDATWPEYNSVSTEIVAHTSNSQTVWANTNAFFLAQFNDAKFGTGSYIDGSANSLSLRATNTLFAFSGKRTRILFSRASDGARLWVDGKRIPFETTMTGSGGSIATNTVSGPWLHFGSLLGATRWRYHGGGLINHAITDDAQAYRITLRGPDAELPWATFGSGTNGVVAAWRVAANGDFRDAGPYNVPAYQIGTVKLNGIGDDLWTTYGRREFIATNSTASSQFRQTYGTVLPGYAEIFNTYGGLLLVDGTNNNAQKAARFGVPNYQSDTVAPLGMVGGLSYSGGGDVNFGGYGSSLFSKASQYLWGYGSTNSDTTGWLGMYSSRNNGLHLLDPATVRWGTNLTSGQHSSISHVEPGRMIQVAPIQFEFWADSGDREVAINTNGMVIESGKSLTLGGVTRTTWPTGLSYSDLTNAILPGANVSFAYDTGLETITISSTGGGGATNGTAITVDSGSFLTTANLADNSRISFSASGTNITADIVSGSVRTNELAPAAISYLTAWSSLTGTPTTLSGYGITDAQPLDADLTRIANVPWALGDLVYRDSTGLTNLVTTSAGRALMAAADAEAQRTLLGLGAMALYNDAPTNGSAYVRSNGTWAIAPTGGSSGSSVSVDGTAITGPNWISSADITNVITDVTNIAPTILDSSIATNKINSTFRTWVESMATGGTSTTNYLDQALFITVTNQLATNLDTASYSSVVGTIKSGMSQTIAANQLSSGRTLRVYASGLMAYPDNASASKVRVRIGSSYQAEFLFGEQDSLDVSTNPSPFQVEFLITVENAGASAAVAGSGFWRYRTSYDADYDAGYVTYTSRANISGTLDTTVANEVAFEFFGDTSAGTRFTYFRTDQVYAHYVADPVVVGGSSGSSTAGTKTLASFRAQQGEPPASNYATFSTRSAIGTALYDQTTQESLNFRWLVPEGYTNTVATVVIKWTTTATSGDAIWGAQDARLTGDIDTISYGTAVETTTTTSGTAGTVMTTTMASVTLNSAVAGDWVWTQVYRKAAAGGDTLAADTELHSVEVRAP